MDKKTKTVLCAGLALCSVDAMANSNIKPIELTQHSVSKDLTRTQSLAAHIVSSKKLSQSMGLSWFALSEKLYVDGEQMSELYKQEMGDLVKTADSCYQACYGNCYGNCYSNCYGNCHGADG